MKPNAQFSVSLMSNTKWRKFFTVLARLSESVFSASWKLTDENSPIEGGLPTVADIWEEAVDACLNGPVDYSRIEWIDLPHEVPYRLYDRAPLSYKKQDLDAVVKELEHVGKFPIEGSANAIESLNSVLRKATRKRKVFPTEQSAMKVAYLAIREASKKWTMPIQNWKLALNRFSIEFGERVTAHL